MTISVTLPVHHIPKEVTFRNFGLRNREFLHYAWWMANLEDVIETAKILRHNPEALNISKSSIIIYNRERSIQTLAQIKTFKSKGETCIFWTILPSLLKKLSDFL